MLVQEKIGTEALAIALVEHFANGGGYYSVPEGWTRIGSGCNRNVFSHTSEPDVVYKIDSGLMDGLHYKEHTLNNSRNYGNFGEWATYMEWVERGNHTSKARLAHMSKYEHMDFPVLACEKVEYVGGFDGRARNVERECKEMIGGAYLWPTDLHAGNWGTDRDGNLIVIDFGHWSNCPGINWYDYDRRANHRALVAGAVDVDKLQVWCPCNCGDQMGVEELLDMLTKKR